MGIPAIEGSAPPIKPVLDKFGTATADRAFLYNPDAVALRLYQKYTDLFSPAMEVSDLAVPMLSVMPSVTPVCFATMYSGVIPDVHGIKKYEKPVLTVQTVFDAFIAAGKKPAIVSTDGDSISKIFLNRDMDYYLYEEHEDVNKKALELIDKDIYDMIVVYNGNYDTNMHRHGPEGEKSLNALSENISVFKNLVKEIREKWKTHNTFFGFMPDHGCHETDGGCGSHGLEMEEDMNIIHFYAYNHAHK